MGLSHLEPPLDLANRCEVLIQLLPVLDTHTALETVCLPKDIIENAPTLVTAPCLNGAILMRVTTAEHPLKDNSRINFLGHRCGLAAPRDIARVGATIT